MTGPHISYSEFRNQQKSFRSVDGTIRYIDQGQGPVLLLLHGVPTSGWLYRKMIPALSGHFRVIAPDMLGFGSSDSPSGYELYNEESHALRLLALMDHLEISRWTHVMHDAGGLWTWELLKKAPERFENLVILNTIILEAGFDPPIRFEPGWMAKAVMWSYRNGITTAMMLQGLFKSGLTENTLSKMDLEGYKTPLLEGKTRAMYYFFTQTCNRLPDYRSVLKTLEVPTLVIWGKHDSFLKWEPQQPEVLSLLPTPPKAIHTLEARHFIQEELPDEIVSAVKNFLGNTSGSNIL